MAIDAGGRRFDTQATVSPTARQRRDVSSELCCPGAIQRRSNTASVMKVFFFLARLHISSVNAIVCSSYFKCNSTCRSIVLFDYNNAAIRAGFGQ